MAPFYTPAILPNYGGMTTVVPVGLPVTPGVVVLVEEELKKAIRGQIEYYFSEENLLRDVFIRRKMDSEGFLPISLIASFHRLQHLTQDVNMIINSLKDSVSVELSENQLKARPRENPLKWPIKVDNEEGLSISSSQTNSSESKTSQDSDDATTTADNSTPSS
jgi:la-related protein 1